MAEMDTLMRAYHEILAIMDEAKQSYYIHARHGMSETQHKEINEKIVCDILSKFEHYIPEYTAARVILTNNTK